MTVEIQATPYLVQEGDGFRISVKLEVVLPCNQVVHAFRRDLGVWPLCPDAARILAEEAARQEVACWVKVATNYGGAMRLSVEAL